MLVKKTVLEAMFEFSDGERMGISFCWDENRASDQVSMSIQIGDCHRSIPVGVGYIREFADMLLEEFSVTSA